MYGVGGLLIISFFGKIFKIYKENLECDIFGMLHIWHVAHEENLE